MQLRQAEKHMQTSLHGIAKRAAVSPDYRFGNLFSLLNEENLRWCFPQLNRKAAPGVDAVDYDTFETNLDENIQKIVEDLKGNRYRAKQAGNSSHHGEATAEVAWILELLRSIWQHRHAEGILLSGMQNHV